MDWIRRHGKILAITLIGIFVFLILAFVGIAYLAAGVMTYRTSNRIDASPTLIADKYENIEFKSPEGLKLKGTYFPKNGSDRLIIYVTGIKPNRFDEYYLIPMIAQDSLAHNYSVLIFDSRAHGISEGARLDYGSTSGRDLVGAVDWAKAKGFDPKKIGILGNSTGAVSMVMVSGELKNVGALILDSSTDNFTNVLTSQIEREGNLPSFFAPLVFYFSNLRFGIDLEHIIPLDHVKDDPNRAYLFLQGDKDGTTSYESAMNLYKHANQNSKFVTFKDVGHVESYRMDHKLWEDSVFPWLDSQLAK